MQPRHIALLLDIDDTLIDFDSSKDKIYWNGIKADTWKIYLCTLKESAKKIGIEIHYGIATFKKFPGDPISTAVIDELKNLLDSNLQFFTDHKSKTTHALDLAKSNLEEEYKTEIPASDMWIFDDIQDVISEAKAKKYQGVQANFADLKPTDQQEAIGKLFEPLYKHLDLLAAMPKLDELSDEEKAQDKIKKHTAEAPVHYATLWHDMMRKPSPPLPTPEELAQEGIKGLDDDEENEPLVNLRR